MVVGQICSAGPLYAATALRSCSSLTQETSSECLTIQSRRILLSEARGSSNNEAYELTKGRHVVIPDPEQIRNRFEKLRGSRDTPPYGPSTSREMVEDRLATNVEPNGQHPMERDKRFVPELADDTQRSEPEQGEENDWRHSRHPDGIGVHFLVDSAGSSFFVCLVVEWDSVDPSKEETQDRSCLVVLVELLVRNTREKANNVGFTRHDENKWNKSCGDETSTNTQRRRPKSKTGAVVRMRNKTPKQTVQSDGPDQQ
ncbi:hypothetical protein OGAPHI_006873 [Ogataea philodendri]|uniref:Uncharacterized protein n=1 Tax=Ogataea philodendri TaxID=1378263 RepID=A0A9P8NV87_9ASCO|nr:uncharacterized protein OGAPHI_006873 [Ogataea philodendri]KAH3660287.1 hypothetical protein OGAPHI_006873 [Ogataea philodendri]